MTAEQNAEMVARYKRVMDGAPDDRPMDPAARQEARAWLASRCQGTDTGSIIIQGDGDADSIARGVGESLRKYAFAARTPVQPPPTHAKPMPARALGQT